MPAVRYHAIPVHDPDTGGPLLAARGAVGNIVDEVTRQPLRLSQDEAGSIPFLQPITITPGGYIPAHWNQDGLKRALFVPLVGTWTTPVWSPQGLEEAAESAAAGAGVAADAAAASADSARRLATAAGVGEVNDADTVVASYVGNRNTETGRKLASTYVSAIVMSGPGIDPTGETDSTAAVIAKVQSAVTSGASVYWPEGIFLTSGNIPGFHVARHSGRGMIRRGSNVFHIEPRKEQKNALFVASEGGTDANDGLSPAQPKRTFQSAFDALAAHGPLLGGLWEVVAAAGVYPAAEAATVKTRSVNRIVVRGPDVGGHPNVPTVILDGAGGAAYSHGIRAVGSGVVVEARDLKLVNFTAGNGDTTRIGLVFEHGADGVATNVHADGASWCGLYATNAMKCMVNGGVFTGSRSNVIYNNSNGTIAGATIGGATESGIYWSRGSQGHIDNCSIEDNPIGVVAAENSRVHTVGNDYRRNSYATRARTGGVIAESGPNLYNPGTANAQIIADSDAYALSGYDSELVTAQAEVRVAYDRANRNITGVTTATDLTTNLWTIPARRLVGPGKQVRVRCYGMYTITGGSVITVLFGGMAVNFTVPGAGSSLVFEVDVTLMEVAGGYRAVGHLSHGLNGIRHGAGSSGFDANADQAITVRVTPAATTDTVTVYRTDVYITG